MKSQELAINSPSIIGIYSNIPKNIKLNKGKD